MNIFNRKLTKRNEFIKLAWLSDHLKRINERTNEPERMKMHECSQHAKQQLCIYCSTCSKAICAQCILPMFDGEHIHHTHSRLDAAQQRLLVAIKEQEKNVQSDLDQLEKCIQIKGSIIDQIKTRRKESLNELEEFQTKIKTEIESEAMKYLKKFQDEQKSLIDERNAYKQKQAMLKKAITSCNQIELFKQEQKIFQRLSQRPKVPKVEKVDLSDDIGGSPLALPWQIGEFVIEQFSVKYRNRELMSSTSILLDHNQYWSLIIYPNGKDLRTDFYFSVMFNLNKGAPQLIGYNLFVELIHHHHDDSKHNYVLKSIRWFKEGQSNGFDQHYKLNNLSIDEFLNPKNDSIKFRFKLRPLSIFEERKLFQWQIESDNENKTKQNQAMKKIEDELANLRQDDRKRRQIIKDQQIEIQKMERYNSEFKRKRTQSNGDSRDNLNNQEDRRFNDVNIVNRNFSDAFKRCLRRNNALCTYNIE
ncbi:unnamed protein product [Rotaria sordida]|uniref:B box-type domain-containing protein n=1 Tax=Rotaria sordida TaxID=392033 RepID=A0A815UMB2_9BILA|nr:unnamed protein product [Rotaria sordida]CAF1524715.1 unnamed protein product [Rotaria sordida]